METYRIRVWNECRKKRESDLKSGERSLAEKGGGWR